MNIVKVKVKIDYVIVLLLLFYSSVAHAESYKISPDLAECPNNKALASAIKINIIPPDYDDSGLLNTQYQLSEIRRMAKRSGIVSTGGLAKPATGGVVAFADVKFSMGYEYTTKYFILPKKPKYQCHYIDQITFKIQFESPPTVLFPSELYEARDLDGGVCFDQIYAHEMQHIYDYEKVFEDIVVQIEQDERFAPPRFLPNKHAMLAVPTKSNATNNDANQKIKALVDTHYGEVVSRTMSEIKREMNRTGQALDSTHEYARISSYCSGMIHYIR